MSKKKFVALFLIILLCIAQINGAVHCKAEVKGNSSIEVPEGYTPVYTIADLAGINSNPSGKYILMNDIDMTEETSPGGSWDTGHGWTPLDEFSGVLEGNGHRIIGMHIYGEGRIGGTGLFSGITQYYDNETDTVIRNLGLVDCDINIKGKSYEDVGGIAGQLLAGTISNCYVGGKISISDSEENHNMTIGGIAGYLKDESKLFGCYIEDCYNTAQLSISTKGEEYGENYVGGIAGQSYGSISNCYNAGEISVSYDRGEVCMGAIAGWTDYYGKNCYYLAVNGLTGIYNDQDVSSGCKALTDVQMKYPASFTGFDFADIWFIDELSSYAYPQLKLCPQVRVKSLELKNPPTKTEYSQGSKLDLSGAVLSITYEDGITTQINVDESMVSGIDMDIAGTQTAVGTYLNETFAFDIIVKEVEVSDISIQESEYTIDRNDKLQLYAVIIPSNASNQSVTWESDNEAVAVVTKTGIVRGINAGSAKITVTSGNGLSASCVVNVKVPAKSIKFDVKKITLKKGRKKTIKATIKPLETTDSVKWTSSNPKIVSVNQKGVIKAKKKGYATIMAKTTSGKYAKVTVTVK